MATTLSFCSPIEMSSSEKIDVHVLPTAAIASPVSGSTGPTAWKRSASSLTAGAKPRPFSVMAWTITGPPNSFAALRIFSIASISWPSTGPKYFNPRSSNIPCGAMMSLIPFFIPWSVSKIGCPTTGVFSRTFFPHSRKRS